MLFRSPHPAFAARELSSTLLSPPEGLSGSCTQLPESRWSVQLLSWCVKIQSVLGSQPLCDPLVSLSPESSRHPADSSSAHGRPAPQGHGLRPRGLRLFLWDSAPEVHRAGPRVTSPCTLDTRQADTGAGPALPTSPAVTGFSGHSLSVSGESPGSV